MNPPQESLQIELSRQAIRNERTRARILAIAFVVVLCGSTIAHFLFPKLALSYGTRLQPRVMVGIMAIALGCELFLWFRLGRLERRGSCRRRRCAT